MRVILSLAVICLVAGNLSLAHKDHCHGVKFLVTAPKMMIAGTTEKICVDIRDSSAIELGVTLEENNYFWGLGEPPENEILAEVIYQMNSQRECFDFQVPTISDNRQRSKLTVEVRNMDESCNRSKIVMISNDRLQTLIQTDKPIYKPGQPVKFRMMSIDKDFKPCNATIPLIYIETPNDIRLAQWVDVQPNRGLVDLEFPMTSEPLLGEWTIKAEFEDRRAEKTFKVEEYVLPKFEITVESTPSYILLTDTSINVQVCARYTYGQPVRGNMLIEATVSSYRNNRPVSIYEEETDSDGCISLDVDLTVFKLRSNKYSTWNAKLKINVDVTDSVTGESLSHSADVAKVSNDALSISVTAPSTFKPGVPFYGTVQVNYPDGTPAGEKLIVLSAEAQETGSYRYRRIFSQNYTSGGDGVIEFIIPDININTTSLTVQALAPGYMDQDHANYTQYRIYDPYGTLYLSAQYSPSGSFVQIEPIRGKLVPGSTQNLNIFFTTNSAETENIPFEFVFMSLGDQIDVPVSALLSRRRRQVDGDGDRSYVVATLPVPNVEVGSSAYFYCSGPGSTVRWYNPTTEIITEGRYEVTHVTSNGVAYANMTIRDVVKNDTGLYTCKDNANNAFEVFLSVSEGTECEGDLVFSSCSTACPLICGQNVSEICTRQCIIGCVCPDGLYRDSINGTLCMTRDNCTREEILIEDEIVIDILPPIYPPIYFPDPDPVNITEPGQLHSTQRSFEVTTAMSPVTSLLVYYIREDGEVVADSITFSVEETFANEVTLDFADSQVEPNDETTLNVMSDPDSLCGVGVVDKSVYVLGGDNAITKDTLFDSIRRYQLDRYGGFYDSSSKCSRRYRNRRRKRTSVPWFGGGSSNFDDSSAAFKNVGLVYLTNLDVETKPCFDRFPVAYYGPSSRGSGGPLAVPVMAENNVAIDLDIESVQDANPEVEIRSYFPETFLWDLFTTDDSGSATIDIQAPHTITDWIANAFCISAENGLGIAPATSLTTFQPFFLSFSLPYSVIRGENVPVKISVFNYLDTCLVVRVTLDMSENFTLSSESNIQDVCVCGGQADSVEFRIVPLAVGQIPLQVNGVSVVDSDTLCGNEIVSGETGAEDTVRRELFVKAEGVPQDYSWSSYFCLADYPFQTYMQRVALPTYLLSSPDIVPDSASGKIIVTGDLLGPSLENLEHLIRLPTGCGEQNMLGFVPNIVALEYLSSTNQLTDKNKDKEEKMKHNMRVGYQRELNYRHRDGSFSAFGERDESGNTWLTAFVVRSLAQASKFIYVDKADLNVSMAWLKSLQDPETGCIQSVGYLGYKAMMGGVSSESMLTAYVVVTYLEAGLPADDEGVVRGLECVVADLESVEDTYALAQIAYALALAERTPELDQVMKKLDGSAVTEGDLRYWNSNREGSPSSYRSASTSSINIEINSYMVLTQFLRNSEQEARQRTSLTVRWLIKNRGAQGGFGSTQDTVMGLTALAKFAANTDEGTSLYVDAKPMSVTGPIGTRRFYLEEISRRKQNEYHFDGMLRFVHLRSRGLGCALIQIVVNYNVMPTELVPSFELKTAVEPLRSKKGVCNDFRLTTSVSYKNDAPDDESNMALVTVVPPSGFYPIKSSLNEVTEQYPAVKRFEIDGEKINFYFDNLDSEVQVFSFDVTKEFDVEDVKPGYVSVTDYYEQSLTKSIELQLECDPEMEPIDGEVKLSPPAEESVMMEMITPPPPPPPSGMMTMSPEEAEEEEEASAERDPGVIPESQDGTPFPGFGYQGTGKEDEQNVSKPAEAEEDKDTSGQNKQEPESKDAELEEGDEGEKEGDATEEGDADKPVKATDGTPTELKTDAPADKPKNETEHSGMEEGPEETDGMVTEIVYVEETEGAPAEETAASVIEMVTPLSVRITDKMVEGTAAMVESTEVMAEGTEVMTEETERMAEEMEGITEETERMAEETEGMAEETEGVADETEGMTEETERMAEETEGMAEETEGMADETEGMAEGTEEMEIVTEVIAEGTEEMAEGTEGMAEETEGMAEETEGMAEETEGMAEETEGMAEETKGMADETEGMAEETEGMAEETEDLVEETEGMAEETEGMAEEEEGMAEVTEVMAEVTEVIAEGTEVMAERTDEDTEEESEETEVVAIVDGADVMTEEKEVVTVVGSTEEAGITILVQEAEAQVIEEVVASKAKATETPSTPPPPTDFDECTVPNICPAGSECFNFPGTYECRCIEGYTEDEDGNCHGCPQCEEGIPEDGMERFCNSNFVYIVKRRASDIRLLREKRFDDEIVKGRVARDYSFPDEYCEERCAMFADVDVRERFIIMANTDSTTITMDQTVTFIPFLGPVISALDNWREDCS